jgi:isoquinoline 1-oxidoreductase beta subunit
MSKISRRLLLQSATALVVGVAFPIRADEKKPIVNPFEAWIRIDSDGKVTLISARSEMGQGVFTSLPMILAEELDVNWADIRIQQAETSRRLYGSQGTGGSASVTGSWLPLRQAAASARAMLIQAAAKRWNVAETECLTRDGSVLRKDSAVSLNYGELISEASRLPIPAPGSVPLKPASSFRIVGKSPPRADIPAKINGSAQFGIDARVPGMLFACIQRCPTFGGRVKRFNADAAQKVSGVQRIFVIPPIPQCHAAGGVAVVATSTWSAMQGRKALTIEWDHGPHSQENSSSLHNQFIDLAQSPGKLITQWGEVDAALAAAPSKVEAEYELPFQEHAPIGAHELHRVHSARPCRSVGTGARSELGIGYGGPGQWPTGERDSRPHHVHGRCIRPALPRRFCGGGSASLERNARAGTGSLDSRRLPAAWLLSPGVAA